MSLIDIIKTLGTNTMTNRYDCEQCTNKCDGKSKMVYDFKNDVTFSEFYEKFLIKRIIEEGFFAQKTNTAQYPDVEVFDKENGTLLCYIEVKVQRRAFMSVKRKLPHANLIPSETLALNLSDLEHYIAQSKTHNTPIYIMWVLGERPCILQGKKVKCFYNKLEVLEKLLNYYGARRRFRRKSGHGDIVNGEHKGVVVNYHFSLEELKPFKLSDVLK